MAKTGRKGGSENVGKAAKGTTTRSEPAASPPPAKTVAAPKAAAAPRVAAPSPDNFALRWTSGANGAGWLAVTYEGPLAARDAVHVRFGVTREGGGPWADIREVRLERRGNTACATGTLDISAGAAVSAIQLVVRAGDDWDNGGRSPLGYYEWRADSRQLVSV